MDSFSPALVKFVGSLVAILALAALAWWLKLGPEPRLDSREEALRAADEAVSGFEVCDCAIDADGRGALLRDTQGRILLLRPHGSHFAGRILPPASTAQIEGEFLVIDTAEKRYGQARLRLQDASAWMQAIEDIR